jgi:hypothetical protein
MMGRERTYNCRIFSISGSSVVTSPHIQTSTGTNCPAANLSKSSGAAFVQAHDAYGAIAPSGQVIDVEFPNVEGATNDKDGSHSGISAPEAEAPLIIISSLLILQFIL